jgi:signal peptidase I
MSTPAISWEYRVKAWLREIKPLFLALGSLWIAETAIAQPFIVPSGSMEPTLLVGDELVASKYPYGYGRFSVPIGTLPVVRGRILEQAPERGDVVVFRLPRDPTQTYVKRVIGLPGDHVQMTAGQLHINGRPVARRAVGRFVTEYDGRIASYTRYVETLPNGRQHAILKIGDSDAQNNTPEFVVPPRHYFLMGDNRDNSLDSRVPAEQGGVGFVPAENLVGRAEFVLFSINPLARWSDIVTRPRALRISRLFESVD